MFGLLAAPLLGGASVMIFLEYRPFVVQSEIGPFPALFSETFFWLPVSASIGALIGGIFDARRDRQTPQIVTFYVLLTITLPVVLVWSAMWFASLVGPTWLREHGLYFDKR